MGVAEKPGNATELAIYKVVRKLTLMFKCKKCLSINLNQVKLNCFRDSKQRKENRVICCHL